MELPAGLSISVIREQNLFSKLVVLTYDVDHGEEFTEEISVSPPIVMFQVV
jgi:hypothetical protein